MSFFPFVNITGAEGANDTLTVNTLGGNDGVDAFDLPANLIGLTINGGAGNDTIIGSQGNDTRERRRRQRHHRRRGRQRHARRGAAATTR